MAGGGLGAVGREEDAPGATAGESAISGFGAGLGFAADLDETGWKAVVFFFGTAGAGSAVSVLSQEMTASDTIPNRAVLNFMVDEPGILPAVDGVNHPQAGKLRRSSRRFPLSRGFTGAGDETTGCRTLDATAR